MLICAIAVCHEKLLGVHSQSNSSNYLQFRGVSAVPDNCLGVFVVTLAI